VPLQQVCIIRSTPSVSVICSACCGSLQCCVCDPLLYKIKIAPYTTCDCNKTPGLYALNCLHIHSGFSHVLSSVQVLLWAGSKKLFNCGNGSFSILGRCLCLLSDGSPADSDDLQLHMVAYMSPQMNGPQLEYYRLHSHGLQRVTHSASK